MAEAELRADDLGGRLLGGMALIAATALWVAAVWLGLYRPELLDPWGEAAQLAVLSLVWAVPVLLTLAAWLSLRRARRALAEARALHSEADALARRLAATRTAGSRNETAFGSSPVAPDGSPASASSPQAQDLSAFDADAAVTSDARIPQESLWTALDFPRSEADEAGFDALRRALADDPPLAAVVRTAQHALSLLSQEGVHPNPLEPSPPPAIWREFAAGTRGAPVRALGEIGDHNALALAVGRLRRDPTFRTAAQRFVAAFDAWLAGFAPHAGDAALARMADSRTARAFRLLGRAIGTFG